MVSCCFVVVVVGEGMDIGLLRNRGNGALISQMTTAGCVYESCSRYLASIMKVELGSS